MGVPRSQVVKLLDEALFRIGIEIEEWWPGSVGADTLVAKDRLDRRAEAIGFQERTDTVKLRLSVGIPLR